MRFRAPLLMIVVILSLFVVVACGDEEEEALTAALGQKHPADNGNADLKGTVEIDGSSTVYPISEAVAEEFNELYPNVRVNVGVSGTGGGFKRFTIGETDVSNASRHMENPRETSQAEENGIKYVELRNRFTL